MCVSDRGGGEREMFLLILSIPIQHHRVISSLSLFLNYNKKVTSFLGSKKSSSLPYIYLFIQIYYTYTVVSELPNCIPGRNKLTGVSFVFSLRSI